MQESEKVMSNSLTRLKEFFRSWRFWKPFLAVATGVLAGFLYYYFIGCNSGSCPITGNPYMSMIWGGLLGFFLVSSPCARGRC
jgi:hypothetical protein